MHRFSTQKLLLIETESVKQAMQPSSAVSTDIMTETKTPRRTLTEEAKKRKRFTEQKTSYISGYLLAI